VAREHAQLRLAMWSDDDFRDLTPAAQHLYMLLLTSPSLSYCGVADWRPRRIAALARGWTVAHVEAAAKELSGRLFIVVDEDTEEVLVRSFVRNDGVMLRDRMATAMAKAHAAVASSVLRGVIVHELVRLREAQPDLGGWGSDRAVEVLGKASVDPSTLLSVEPSAMPQPIDQTELSVDLPPTPAPSSNSKLPAPYDSLRSSPPSIDITAQTVTAGWVDASKANGVEPSKSQIGQVAKKAKELLAKNDPGRVLAAAKAAGTKGYTNIDRELTVMAGRTQPGGLPAHTNRDPTTGRLVER
jgi:hypothetical protein